MDDRPIVNRKMPIDWCVTVHLATVKSWPHIKKELMKLSHIRFDLYVNLVENYVWTTKQLDEVESEIRKDFAHCDRIVIERNANLDMDIGGFLNSLSTILKSDRTYKYLFKIHSKTDFTWLNAMLGPLVNGFDRAYTMFEADPSIGMFVPSTWLIQCPDIYDYGCFDAIKKHFAKLSYPTLPNQNFAFAAGTMFTIRLSILSNWIDMFGGIDVLTVDRNRLTAEFSHIPQGEHRHAPWLHAMERLFGILVTMSGYSIRGILCAQHDGVYGVNQAFKLVSNVYVSKPLIVAPTANSSKVTATYTVDDYLNFDVIWYLMKNTDVQKAFNFEKQRLLLRGTQHWLVHGRKEGRLPFPKKKDVAPADRP
jgi:hypothetical protein